MEKRKISETVYKNVQVCYLLPTDYKLIFWTSCRWPPFTSKHCCKRVWKLPYTRLRRSSSIAATSSTMACLSSWRVMIRPRNTRSFRNPHRKKSGTVSSGDRAGQAMSPKLRTQVTRCCTFQRSIATDHMKWRPLLYHSPSRQLRQPIAPAQYSNLKCVSRLCATLYKTNLPVWFQHASDGMWRMRHVVLHNNGSAHVQRLFSKTARSFCNNYAKYASWRKCPASATV